MQSTVYVWRVFIILICVVLFGLLLQRFLRPISFGEIGPYRANSLAEIANQESVHQGKEGCRECHDKIWNTHQKDIHFSVQCEVCHATGDVHVKYHLGEVKLISKEDAQMPKKYTLEGCLFCHRKLYSRPRTFAQIDPVEHYKFLGITGTDVRCTECHSPHEPLFLLDEVKKARIHPAIYECEDCHDSRPKKEIKEVADHPVVFACQDCHRTVVEDSKNTSTLSCGVLPAICSTGRTRPRAGFSKIATSDFVCFAMNENLSETRIKCRKLTSRNTYRTWPPSWTLILMF